MTLEIKELDDMLKEMTNGKENSLDDAETPNKKVNRKKVWDLVDQVTNLSENEQRDFLILLLLARRG